MLLVEHAQGAVARTGELTSLGDEQAQQVSQGELGLPPQRLLGER